MGHAPNHIYWTALKQPRRQVRNILGGNSTSRPRVGDRTAALNIRPWVQECQAIVGNTGHEGVRQIWEGKLVQRVWEIQGTKGYGKYRDRTNALNSPHPSARELPSTIPTTGQTSTSHPFPPSLPQHRDAKQIPTLPRPQTK